MLIEDGLLSLDDSLGDIFPDAAAWTDIIDDSTDFRKSATIEELLTMTSGLFDTPIMMNGPEGGGQSLQGSLSYPNIGNKGKFAYLASSQIHSYIIKERTGMTPRQYLAENVMGKLGIAENEYNWEQNDDGIEMGGILLILTPIQMAKFGQLYLQGGRTNPSNDDRLISENWIDASLSYHATIDFSTFGMSFERLQGGPYGYCFNGLHEHPSGSTVYCAVGGPISQLICVDRDLDRVMIVQRESESPPDFKVLDLVVDSTLSFSSPEVGLPGFSSTV